MAQFVDWDLAAATAGMLGKTGPRVTLSEASEIVAELRRLADEAVGHVEAFTGMTSSTTGPIRVVDRKDWADVNIAGLRAVFVPLLSSLTRSQQPGPLADAVGSRITGVQAGTVFAYLSGRVLGQYEVFSSHHGTLLLVAPNIMEAERKLQVNPRDFRLWVCLHEVTHRTQFTAVPWLRDHLLAEVAAFVEAGGAPEQVAERLRRAIGSLVDIIRNPNGRGNLLDLVQTPAQRAVLDRITALMTLLEGHAEFVMDEVGPGVVATVSEIRAKFNRRREAANAAERVIRRLLGIDAKLRQYAEGRRFVHEVVSRVGMAGLNKVWQSPQTLPRLSELSNPEAWIARVGADPLPAAG